MNRSPADRDALPVPTDEALRQPFLHLETQLLAGLIGHERLVSRLLIALLAAGHVLIEGPPGTAKTRTVRRFAAGLALDFVRIQATPDLLPADITGSEIYRASDEGFRYVPGPLFNHVVLVDEINRAPPKVQSALLEAMGETQVSVGGETRRLPDPFIVVATQNPLEHEGTYPLPEAQLDRFMFQVHLRHPVAELERRILDTVLAEAAATAHGEVDVTDGSPLADADLIAGARHAVRRVHIAEAVRDYIVRLADDTRHGAYAPELVQPASSRGSILLARASQARAFLASRDYVTPDDVAELAEDVLSVRIALDLRLRAEGRDTRDWLAGLLARTPRA